MAYALFFSLLLIGVALLFRETLATSLEEQSKDVLQQEWAAMKGYLRIEKGKQGHWFYDRDDPDESFIVERLRRVYLLTDGTGGVMEISTIYQSLGPESPETIAAFVREQSKKQKPVWTTRYNSQGQPFLLRSGVVYDEGHHEPYFVAMGSPLSQNRKLLVDLTWQYTWLIPIVVALGSILGWFLAGRALNPVMEVASAAQRISGSNLSLRIPERGAGDELDYLIATFNRMIQRLESSFQQIRQFSTDVSHELRTPITAIRGQLEVALFTAKTTEQYHEAMINSLQDVERLSQIVRALLLLSQAESGQLALQKTRLDMTALVRDVVDQFQIVAESKQVTLTEDLIPACEATVDRVQIERMLSNLVSNAMKFTGPGGEIRVKLDCHGGEVSLVVEDTGCGISPEHLPHIFDRFYRVPYRHAGTEHGLGLGLSFVAWIAKAHEGTVKVDSSPGQGTRFTIRFPTQGESVLAAAVE